MKNKWPWLALSLILAFGLWLRLYKIDIPLADHHSWRQADTAAVSRNFIKEGFNFFYPKIDNMTYLQSPQLLNPERLFMAEPPIYNSLVAAVYKITSVKEAWARAVTIFFSLGSVLILYLILDHLTNRTTALWGALIGVGLPYGIFYGRVILPEPLMVFVSLVWLWFVILWIQRENHLAYWGAIMSGAIALTQKSFPIFLGLPVAYLILRGWGLRGVFQKKHFLQLVVMLILTFLPFVAWRWWVGQHPAGVPPFDWLFNQGMIRFRPAFFRWIFAERIAKLILGYWGLPLFVLGVAVRPNKKEGWFFHWWLVSFLIYVTVLAAGNVTHDYYQIPFIPLAAIFVARGVEVLTNGRNRIFAKPVGWLIALVCLGFGFGFGWFQVRDFYNIQSGVDVAGIRADELLPKDALVLTGDTNDSTLLYNCNRWGLTGGYASYFPNTSEHIEKARLLGVDYYVTTKVHEIVEADFGQWLLANYELVEQGNQHVIVDLRKEK